MYDATWLAATWLFGFGCGSLGLVLVAHVAAWRRG